MLQHSLNCVEQKFSLSPSSETSFTLFSQFFSVNLHLRYFRVRSRRQGGDVVMSLSGRRAVLAGLEAYVLVHKGSTTFRSFQNNVRSEPETFHRLG